MIQTKEERILICDICDSGEDVKSFTFSVKDDDGHRDEWGTEHVEPCRSCQASIFPAIKDKIEKGRREIQ